MSISWLDKTAVLAACKTCIKIEYEMRNCFSPDRSRHASGAETGRRSALVFYTAFYKWRFGLYKLESNGHVSAPYVSALASGASFH